MVAASRYTGSSHAFVETKLNSYLLVALIEKVFNGLLLEQLVCKVDRTLFAVVSITAI